MRLIKSRLLIINISKFISPEQLVIGGSNDRPGDWCEGLTVSPKAKKDLQGLGF
jgi:hypothetical protein